MRFCFSNKIRFLYCKIIIVACCLHYSMLSQKKIEFEITYGVYINDHPNRTFDAQERKWILKNEKLIYFIDAHNKRYSDTLKLKKSELDSIINCVKENKLTGSIKKDLSKDYMDKYEWTGSINGHLSLNGKAADFNIKANSSSELDEDPDSKRLKKLEDLLYEIIAKQEK